ALGRRAGCRAVAAADPARPGRSLAAQVPVSISAARSRSRRQIGRERLAGEAVGRYALAALLAVRARAGAARAQQPSIEASVDRPVIHDNESFTYTIRADGSVRGDPEIGAL